MYSLEERITELESKVDKLFKIVANRTITDLCIGYGQYSKQQAISDMKNKGLDDDTINRVIERMIKVGKRDI